MNSLIDQLKEASPKEEYRISGATWNLLRNILRSLHRGDNVNSSPTVKRNQNGNAGFTLEVIPTPPGVISSVPFGVSWRINPNDPSGNTYQAMVNVDSDLLLSLKPTNNMTVTGLGSWFDFIPNDVITLWIPVTDGVPQSATIQSYGQGTTTFDPDANAWASGDNSYVINGGSGTAEQTGINVMLAYSIPRTDNGKPYLIQCITTHLRLEWGAIDGLGAYFPFSAPSRRYGITGP